MKNIIILFLCLILYTTMFSQIPDVPRFGRHETYRSFRAKMLKAGWKPVHFKDADDCTGIEWCTESPEMRTWQGTSPGYITFMWSRRGTMVVVTALDDPPYVESVKRYGKKGN